MTPKTDNRKPKTEITCDLWRRGPEEEIDLGPAADAASKPVRVTRCTHYQADGARCLHKAGPLICPTGGQRSALR